MLPGPNRASWRWTFSCMEDFNIWLVLGGSGVFDLDGQTITLSRGTCVIIQPGSAGGAEQKPGNPLHTIAVHFLPDESFKPELPQYCKIDDVDFFSRLMERAVKCSWLGDQEGADYWLGGIVTEIGRSMGHGKRLGSHQEELEGLCRKIEFNPEKKWLVGELAGQTFLSREHFSKLFRQFKGMSPQQYIVKCRLDRSYQLLLNSNLTIAEIADVCGYSSEFFFSRQFKEYYGEAPTTLRKAFR